MSRNGLSYEAWALGEERAVTVRREIDVEESPKFHAGFKPEAEQMIHQRELSVDETARRLDVHENVLRKWQPQSKDNRVLLKKKTLAS